MPIKYSIAGFIRKLAATDTSTYGCSLNLYRGRTKASQVRRHNLLLYLKQMEHLQPSTLLLGEAPGYKGCALTGVPFSSELLLQQHSFFRQQAYRLISSKQQPQQPQKILSSEVSANIVWTCLQEWREKPLIWNIFPFHPHRCNHLQTNRTPNKAELMLGRQFLLDLLKRFPDIKRLIAVGRKAEQATNIYLNLPVYYVRHPSYGGKQKFTEGMKLLNAAAGL